MGDKTPSSSAVNTPMTSTGGTALATTLDPGGVGGLPPPGSILEEPEIVDLHAGGLFSFPSDVDAIKTAIQWSVKQSDVLPNLDVSMTLFDERARLTEMISSTGTRISRDRSCQLRREFDSTASNKASNGSNSTAMGSSATAGIANKSSGMGGNGNSNGNSKALARCEESAKIEFSNISAGTAAIVIFLHGGPRNFKYIQTLSGSCIRSTTTHAYGDYGLSMSQSGHSKMPPFFQYSTKSKKTYHGLFLGVLYRDGWVAMENTSTSSSIESKNGKDKQDLGDGDIEQRPLWHFKCCMEPCESSTRKEIQEQMQQLVIASVPSLEKYRPRIFRSVREVCAALSSQSLPKLKKKFQRSEEGLGLLDFIDALFKQLTDAYPALLEEAEASYTVAMLHEMFHQIDYNGDGACSWDEFTSFCVETGMASSSSGAVTGSSIRPGGANGASGTGDSNGNNSDYSLEQYVIEYGEEILQRDHHLSPYRFVSQMRYVKENRRLLIIPEDSDNILIMNENFRVYSNIYPSKIQKMSGISSFPSAKNASSSGRTQTSSSSVTKSGGSSGGGTGAVSNSAQRAIIYDVVYLSGRDLYAYSSSDHSITIAKEQTALEGTKIHYFLWNRIFHSLLHLKLCWSEKHDLLCSTGSDRVIYGWNIETSEILFQVSRHTDIITDFISVDHHDLFITCSMDKHIVMWSATSRRVKGVLQKHTRGVRTLSVYENTLLSSGFECDGYLWDISSKDCIGVLRGHRHPIVVAKLMCERANSDREHRAVTVDETGEFRLWNIYVRERTAEPVALHTIQIFEMQNSESPLNHFRFLAMPYNPRATTGYYSDLIACSTKLLHFLPEKNMKEFIPPTACTCNEASALLVTSVGKNILTYDLSSGEFTAMFSDITKGDIFSICMDGERGRRMYLGTSNGEVSLVNTLTGSVIDTVHFHTKEVTAICQLTDPFVNQKDNLRLTQASGLKQTIFSCSADGHIRCYDETSGQLHLQNSIENLFGEGVPIMDMKHVPSLRVLLVASGANEWAIVNDVSLKKVLVVSEKEPVTSIEVLGASKDREDLAELSGERLAVLKSWLPELTMPTSTKESLLTVAISSATMITIYTIDIHNLRGVKSYELPAGPGSYLTDITLVIAPDVSAVNYTSSRHRTAAQLLRDASSKSAAAAAQAAKSSHNEDSSSGNPFLGSQLMACTDDGRLMVWDSLTFRHQSELKHRTAYKPGSQFLKRMNSRARENISYDTLNSPGTALTSPTSFPNSMSSPVNSADGEASTAFLTAIDTESPPITSPIGKLTSQNSFSWAPTITQKTWLDIPASDIFPLAPPLQIDRINAQRRVTDPLRKGSHSSFEHILPPSSITEAHCDTIPFLVPLQSHACVVSVSHDGYQRVWNLDLECLGELLLPNLSEAMKATARCKEPGAQWRFILERIPVLQIHKDIGARLCRQLRLTHRERHLEYSAAMRLEKAKASVENGRPPSVGDRRNRSAALCARDISLATATLEPQTEQARLRESVLRSLNEPPSVVSDLPPSRLPTREEKEMIKITLLNNPDELLEDIPADDTLRPGGLLESSLSLGHLGLDSPSRYAVDVNSTTLSPLRTPSRSNSAYGSPRRDHNGIACTCPQVNNLTTSLFSSQTISQSPTRRINEDKLRLSLAASHDESGDGNDNLANVCLSCFGVPSLWTIPGERDIFGRSTQQLSPRRQTRNTNSCSSLPEQAIPPAFSEASITMLQREGLIDVEGRQILRKIAQNASHIEAYDRSQPTLLIRNLSMSTSFKLPAIESLKKTEIKFGAQKDMYKNAEKLLLDNKNNGGRGGSNKSGTRDELSGSRLEVIRNAVAMTRIEQNMRKMRSTIHLIHPPSHDEVILPQNDGNGGGDAEDEVIHAVDNAKRAAEERQRRRRLLQSSLKVPPTAERKPLDTDMLGKCLERVEAAMHESDRRGNNRAGREVRIKNAKKKAVFSLPQMQMREKELCNAIKATALADESRRPLKERLSGMSSNATESSLPTPTSPQRMSLKELKRNLMPSYTIEKLSTFVDAFTQVDSQFTGRINQEQWANMMSSMDHGVQHELAKVSFQQLAKDKPFITIRELVPVIFCRANKKQQRMICDYVDSEFERSKDCQTRVSVTVIEYLFGAYDTDNVGYVDVSLIKERVAGMKLPDFAMSYFADLVVDMADDEMVNLAEFKRLLKPFSDVR